MILSRTALYPQQRFDIPDARAIEALGQNDWIYFLKGIISSKSVIISGFEVTNYANIFTVPGVQLSQNNVALLHPEATTQAAGFYVSSGTEADYRLVLSSSNAGLTTNYVEVDLSVTTGSPDTRAFWDAGANVTGAEYTDTVDTVINLNLAIDVNISGFTTGRIPLYKIITNSDGTVNSITDCRPLYFRLGTGGTSPNPNATASFPNYPDSAHARFESPSTATSANTSNAPYQGGDKNIKSEKQWKDWVMTLIKEINGTPYWYSKPTASRAGTYQNAALTFIKGGVFYHGRAATVTAKTSTTVTVGADGQFTSGAGTFAIGANQFTYTSYNSSLKRFNGVSPTPNTIAAVGTIVFQTATGELALTGGSTIVRLGQSNSTVQPFPYLDMATNPTLWVLLSTDGSTASYGMGYDGITPIIPKDITALTSTSVTVATGGNYVTTGGNLLIHGQPFSYASYNAGTGLFTSVSPDPTGLGAVTDTVFQDISSGIGYYHQSTTARVPATINDISEGVERVFWLAYYDGVQTMFIRDSELIPGESASSGADDSAQLYEYIGSTGASDNFPIYDVASIANGTNLTEAIKDAFEIIETPIYDEKVLITGSSGTSATLWNYGMGITPTGDALLFAGATQTYTLALDGNVGTPASTSGLNALGITTGRWIGNKFTLASSTVMGKVRVIGGSAIGTPTGNLFVDIYPSNGSIPNGALLFSSDAVLASSVAADTNIDFTFSAAGFPTLAAGDYVFLVRGTTDDGANAAQIKTPGAGYTAHGNSVTTSTARHAAVTSVTSTQVGVAGSGVNGFLPSASDFVVGSTTYTYSSYNSTTGLFTGVSPNPVGNVTVGQDLRQELPTGGWLTASYQIYYQIFSESVSGGLTYSWGDLITSSGGTADTIVMKLKKIGSPVCDLVMQVWSSTGAAEDPPGSILVSSTVIPAASLTTSYAQVSFTIPSTSLPSTTYSVILHPTNITTLDTANNVAIAYVPNGDGIGRTRYSSNNEASFSFFTANIPITVSGTTGATSVLPSGSSVFLPINSKTSTAALYSLGTDELEVYENGVLLQRGYDYTELTSGSIQTSRDVWAGSFLRFRIASVGGAGAASGGGGSGQSLQSSYANGNTITVATSTPVIINGPSGQKLLHVAGNVQIDGLLDPTGIQLTPQSTNPFPMGMVGIWVDQATDQMVFTRPNGSPLPMGQIMENLASSTPYFSKSMTNLSGATIPAGAPVFISNTNEIMLAEADDNIASRFFGIAKTTIPNGSTGEIIFQGIVPGIMTGSGYSASTRIWLQSTPGAMSDVAPSTSGSYQVQVGLVNGNDLILQIQDYGQVV